MHLRPLICCSRNRRSSCWETIGLDHQPRWMAEMEMQCQAKSVSTCKPTLCTTALNVSITGVHASKCTHINAYHVFAQIYGTYLGVKQLSMVKLEPCSLGFPIHMLSDGESQASRLCLDTPAVALRIAEQQGRGRTWPVKDVGILKKWGITGGHSEKSCFLQNRDVLKNLVSFASQIVTGLISLSKIIVFSAGCRGNYSHFRKPRRNLNPKSKCRSRWFFGWCASEKGFVRLRDFRSSGVRWRPPMLHYY